MPTFLQDSRMLAWILAGVAFLVAFVLILKIVEIAIDLRRRLPRGARSRQLRLGFVESFDLDGERQLMLVRRDNIEHLLMIGGPNDVLIESGILRAEPRDGRFPRNAEQGAAPHHAPPAPPPAEMAASVAAMPPAAPPPVPLVAPLAAAPFAAAPFAPAPIAEEPVALAALHLAPEPAAPVFAPVPHHEPEPAPPHGEPAAQIAAILAAPPPPPAPEPVAPVAPPAPRFPLPPRVGPAKGLAGFGAPRFPAPPPPAGDAPPRPRFVAPTFARRAGADRPVDRPAGEAPPAFAPLPPFPAPDARPHRPEPENRPEPRPDHEPHPLAPHAAPPAPMNVTPAKDDMDFEPLDTLEEEMAKLLGRPLNK